MPSITDEPSVKSLMRKKKKYLHEFSIYYYLFSIKKEKEKEKDNGYLVPNSTIESKEKRLEVYVRLYKKEVKYVEKGTVGCMFHYAVIAISKNALFFTF